MLKTTQVFDLSSIREGMTIRATSTEWEAVNNNYARDLILLEVSPLEIKGVYYSGGAAAIDKYGDNIYANNLKWVKIRIEDVVNGNIEIKKLVEERA